MKVDRYSNTILAVLAFSFYILQGASFALMIITLIKSISLITTKKNYRNYFALVIAVLLAAIFGYEIYWFLNHI
jgi:hypothetical protein